MLTENVFFLFLTTKNLFHVLCVVGSLLWGNIALPMVMVFMHMVCMSVFFVTRLENRSMVIASRFSTLRGVEAIQRLALGFVRAKLSDPAGNFRWSRQRVRQAIRGYKAYLEQRLLHPDAPENPLLDVDEVWHLHILHTKRYRRDCRRIFGYFLHHVPGVLPKRAGEATCSSDAPSRLATCSSDSRLQLVATCSSDTTPTHATCR